MPYIESLIRAHVAVGFRVKASSVTGVICMTGVAAMMTKTTAGESSGAEQESRKKDGEGTE